MAGGGIAPTALDIARIRRVVNVPWRLATWLTILDEDGWRAAQELLAEYARIDERADALTKSGNPEKHGDLP